MERKIAGAFIFDRPQARRGIYRTIYGDVRWVGRLRLNRYDYGKASMTLYYHKVIDLLEQRNKGTR
jgi:hypothetical protein